MPRKPPPAPTATEVKIRDLLAVAGVRATKKRVADLVDWWRRNVPENATRIVP